MARLGWFMGVHGVSQLDFVKSYFIYYLITIKLITIQAYPVESNIKALAFYYDKGFITYRFSPFAPTTIC